MLATTIAAITCAALISSSLGGARAAWAATIALAVASLASFLPAVLSVGAAHWGMVVLASGVGRSLLVLAIVYAATENGLPSRPTFLGAGAGALFVLVVETVLAIVILSAIERTKQQLKNTPGASSLPRSVEHA